jgi:hypothetical protein
LAVNGPRILCPSRRPHRTLSIRPFRRLPVTPSRTLVAAALCASFAALAAAAPAGAQAGSAGRASAPTRTKETAMQAELEMMEQEQSFRMAVGEFMEAAAAGDAARAERLISPNMRAQAGAAAVARFLEKEIMPFFAGFPEQAGSRTITRTTDQFGSAGFTYYLYASPRGGGERRPFVVYVVNEGGRPVVANVLVDRFVEGRHR